MSGVLLPWPGSNQAVFSVLETWVGYLAEGDYGSAHALLSPDPHRQWTPAVIEALVTGYGSLEPRRDGRRFRVTPLASAIGTMHRTRLEPDADDDAVIGEVHPRFPLAVYWFREPSARRPDRVGYAHVDYPLDGTWSDLSSEFYLLRVGEYIRISLERIEVM